MKLPMLLLAGLTLCDSASMPAEPNGRSCNAEPLTTTRAYGLTDGSAPLRVRLSWEDFVKGHEGAKRLASLEKGIAKMKLLNAARGSIDPQRQLDYKRSWEYWANIHGFFGVASMNHVTVKMFVTQLNAAHVDPEIIASFNGLLDQTPPKDGVAPKVWGTCQPSSGNTQADFWGWHRIYLYYFEKMLRWAAGDDTLNLPYWDYTDVKHLALPAEFLDTKSPLFEPRRAPAVNAGGKLPQHDTDVDKGLVLSSYLDAELNVEEGVHGNVHCDVGGGVLSCPEALMGKVPVAGNDPIFYIHHANIDRLWACWDKMHNNAATGPWLSDTFSFPDETGILQTRKVSDFLSTEANGYVYERTTNCLRNPKQHAMRVAAMVPQNKETMSVTVPTVVGSAATVKLTQPKTMVDISVPTQMIMSLTRPTGPVETKVVLNRVTAKTPPGTILHVYVEAKGKPAQRKFVGTINWFTAFEHEGGPDVRTVTFDITDEVKTLGVGPSGLTVTFEASPGVVAPPAKGGLAARTPKTAAISPNSDLTIGLVEIRQEPVKQ